jgi:hypothetical protein
MVSKVMTKGKEGNEGDLFVFGMIFFVAVLVVVDDDNDDDDGALGFFTFTIITLHVVDYSTRARS